jgi:hypothetical protein
MKIEILEELLEEKRVRKGSEDEEADCIKSNEGVSQISILFNGKRCKAKDIIHRIIIRKSTALNAFHLVILRHNAKTRLNVLQLAVKSWDMHVL